MKKFVMLSLICLGAKSNCSAQKLMVGATLPSVAYQSLTVAINEISLDRAIKIFPNPAVHEINVVSSEGYEIKSCDIYIYDEKGTIVLSEKNQTFKSKAFTVDVQNLAEGLYTLVLKTPDNKAAINKKFVIAK